MGKRELLSEIRKLADTGKCNLNSKEGRQILLGILVKLVIDKPSDFETDQIEAT